MPIVHILRHISKHMASDQFPRERKYTYTDTYRHANTYKYRIKILDALKEVKATNLIWIDDCIILLVFLYTRTCITCL